MLNLYVKYIYEDFVLVAKNTDVESLCKNRIECHGNFLLKGVKITLDAITTIEEIIIHGVVLYHPQLGLGRLR